MSDIGFRRARRGVSGRSEEPRAGGAALSWSAAIGGGLRWSFVVAILLAALPLGANRPWAWSPIVAFLGGLAVLQAVAPGASESWRVRPAERRLLGLLVLCGAIVVGLAVLQLLPSAPPAWHAELYARAGAALGRELASLPTINADATRATLMRVGACALVFLMARALLRDRRHARLFLLLFVASATLVTLYGFVMQASNGSCYVFAYSKRDGFASAGPDACNLSGTFINSNSYATYAGMGLVAAFGLTIGRPPGASDGTGTWLTATRAACLIAIFFLLGGVLLSASRAGFASTVLASIVLALLLLRGRWPSHPAVGWAIVAAILLVALLLLIGGSAVYYKAGKLADADVLGRVRIWQVAVEAILQAPWLGWGLGTFTDVYALFQPPDLPTFMDKAHSTPLEWVLELGVPGAFFAFLLVLLPMFVALRGVFRRRTDRYLPATSFAVVLVAVVHSLVDFSLQMPAIGLVTAAVLGVGWAHGHGRRE